MSRANAAELDGDKRRWPYKFTKVLGDRIVANLLAGNYRETSAQAVGISKQTFYDWLIVGLEPGAPDDLRDFVENVAVAESQSECDAVGYIRTALGKESQWQARAWWLERKYTARWGRSNSLNLDDPSKMPDDKLVDSLLERLLANPITAERARARLSVIDGGKK